MLSTSCRTCLQKSPSHEGFGHLKNMCMTACRASSKKNPVLQQKLSTGQWKTSVKLQYKLLCAQKHGDHQRMIEY